MERNLTVDEMINIVNLNLNKYESGEFTLNFYVVDSEGYPNGMLAYIYETAFALHDKGYNVNMIYSDPGGDDSVPFVGVGEWLGAKYAELPHKNINKENLDLTACDFVFIPEFASRELMMSLKDVICKKVLILQNRRTLCESMPNGITPMMFGIMDCIVPTESLKKYVETYFVGMRCHIVRPVIRNMFRENLTEKRLIINLMVKDRNLTKRIMNEFYWRFPVYKWVTFRDLRGLAQENVCNSLMDGAISVWIDDNTEFGLPILEALKCRSVVIAKIPDIVQPWMTEENGNLINSVVWFEDFDKLPEMLAGVVRTWTLDLMPEDLYEDIEKSSNELCGMFSQNVFNEEVSNEYSGLIEERKASFKSILSQLEAENKKNKTNE